MKALQLRSEPLIRSTLAIRVGDETLRAGDLTKRRGELIAAVRAGTHHELSVDAITFRQRDGHPNRKFLRFKPEALAAVAASYIGQPLILDHNAWDQHARIGTITASSLVHEAGAAAFKQTLQVVKPEAVISVLDGTLDRFSIGWNGTGAVMCTAHKVDVRSRGACGCWPGDIATIDGKQHVVEYEFQSAEGTEVSGVNVPAVKGTGISDVRAALAAERQRGLLVLPDRRRSPLARSAPARRAQPDAFEAECARIAELGGLDVADVRRTALAIRDGRNPLARDPIHDVAEQLGLDVRELEQARRDHRARSRR